MEKSSVGLTPLPATSEWRPTQPPGKTPPALPRQRGFSFLEPRTRIRLAYPRHLFVRDTCLSKTLVCLRRLHLKNAADDTGCSPVAPPRQFRVPSRSFCSIQRDV